MAVLLGLAAAGLVQGQDALADGAHAGFKLAEFIVEIRVGRCAVRMRFGSLHHLVGGCDIGLQRRRHRVQIGAQCGGQRQFAVGCQRLAEFAGVFAQCAARGRHGFIVFRGGSKQRRGDIAAQGVVHHVRLHMVAQRIGGDDLCGNRIEQAALAVIAHATQGEQRQCGHQHQDAQHVHDLHGATRVRSGKTGPRRARDPVSGR